MKMLRETYSVKAETLRSFMIDVFLGAGVPRADAEITADVLLASDLRGVESHGVQRLKMYYDRIKSGIQKAVTDFEIVREGPTTAVVDGHHGMGQVIGYRSMELAIEKAKKYGMGSVAVRNSTHFGIDGYYPLMAVKAGMAGMTFTNARPAIAPTFGVQPMLGTNPIAFGAPSDEDLPFLYDGATSIIQRGKVEVHGREDKALEGEWVIDQQGEIARDPHQILAGIDKDQFALLPLGGPSEESGGHKGYGLATMVEIFSASFQTGAFLHDLLGVDKEGKKRPYMVGHFFMAIDVSQFVPLEDFKKTTGDILRELRASQKIPGHDRIYTAGEKEFYNERRIREEGIPINPSLQKDFQALARELNLKYTDIPFLAENE
jgi:L-2-hydroxycarboxylate dehydrogenase (NAD+)